MLKINVKNINKELKKVSKTLEKEIGFKVQIETINALKDLAKVTPVDTGKAKNSWDLEINNIKPHFTNSRLGIREAEYKLINTVPYINKLNEGSSKQRPARFIETTLLNNGLIPIGVIVQKR